MKQIAIVAILFLVAVTGCTKIQHPEEISVGKIESYNQLVSAVTGVYGKLSQNDIYLYLPNIKADDLNEGTPYYNEYYTNNPNDCWPGKNLPGQYNDDINEWKAWYQVIASANNIIVQFNLTNSDRKTREILGEIYLIRAYCYFRLTRTYKNVPIINNINISYSVHTASVDSIYKFIENDLKTAAKLLPENNASARIPYVTPHRGTAKAILAEVYLSWAGYPVKDSSKYALAAKEAGEVIDSANFFGFGLVQDFAWLWDHEHFYNKESEFTLYYADPSYSNDLNNVNRCYIGFFYNYQNHMLKNYDFSNFQAGFNPTEVKFFNDFPQSYRKDITFITTIYVPPRQFS